MPIANGGFIEKLYAESAQSWCALPGQRFAPFAAPTMTLRCYAIDRTLAILNGRLRLGLLEKINTINPACFDAWATSCPPYLALIAEAADKLSSVFCFVAQFEPSACFGLSLQNLNDVIVFKHREREFQPRTE